MNKCTPKPIYHDDPCWEFKGACKEDHEHVVTNYLYTTTVLVKSPFNMPAKGEALELELDRVQSLSTGVVLWSPRVGFLHVKSFSKETGTALVENLDEADNLSVGSAVLANEEFTVGVPYTSLSKSEDSITTPLLAADFVAPGAGACQIASVTTVNGITEGGTVSIQGCQYRVSSVIDKNTLRLCDDGKGAVKGSIIKYDVNECGTPSVAVVSHSTNPCTNTPVQKGNLVACNNGDLTTIKGDAVGQGLIWDGTNWVLKYIDTAVGCTTLTSCWVLDTTEVTEEDSPEYLLNIFNIPAGFVVDNKITIYNSDTGEYDKFVIKEIVSNTEGNCQIRVSPIVTPTAIHTFGRGEVLCLEECCDWVPTKLAETVDSDEWRPKNIGTISFGSLVVKETPASELSSLETVGDSVTVTTDTDGERFLITNSNKYSKANVFIRAYCWSHGRLRYTGSSSESSMFFNLKHILQVKYVTYSLNSSNEVVSANHYKYAVIRKGVQADLSAGNGKLRDDFFQSVELFVELPEYDEEHPELSSALVSLSAIIRLIKKSSGSNWEWEWVDETSDEEDPEEATPQKSIELRLAVEGVRQ